MFTMKYITLKLNKYSIKILSILIGKTQKDLKQLEKRGCMNCKRLRIKDGEFITYIYKISILGFKIKITFRRRNRGTRKLLEGSRKRNKNDR